MKKFKVVKTFDGQNYGQTLGVFDNIEDARNMLAEQLRFANNAEDGGVYTYFGSKASAESEIDFANEAETRESWGDERVDRYIAALKEGIDSGMPFIAESEDGDCVTICNDSFRYDNYTVEVVEHEYESVLDIKRAHDDKAADIEVYEALTSSNSFHTDNLRNLYEDVNDLEVVDYELMSESEYAETVLANSSLEADFAAWYGDKNAKVLVILVRK